MIGELSAAWADCSAGQEPWVQVGQQQLGLVAKVSLQV